MAQPAPTATSRGPSARPADATPAPTQRPGGGTPAPTPVRTPVPTAPPPQGTSITFADGSVVSFSGPARVNIGSQFSVTFTVRNANNTPGTGTLLVSFGNASTGGFKTSSGTLNWEGPPSMKIAGHLLPGE